MKPALVLDLDETLIKSTVIKTSQSSHVLKIGRRRAFVQLRPGLSEFIKEVKEMFDLVFFTSSQENYANQIIDLIAPETPHDRRFFRDSCKCICGYPVKDLSLLKQKMEQIILVDDIRGSALLQPKNLIKINEWQGDMEDTVLTEQLLPVLKRIHKENNLPDVMKKLLENNDYKDLQVFE